MAGTKMMNSALTEEPHQMLERDPDPASRHGNEKDGHERLRQKEPPSVQRNDQTGQGQQSGRNPNSPPSLLRGIGRANAHKAEKRWVYSNACSALGMGPLDP